MTKLKTVAWLAGALLALSTPASAQILASPFGKVEPPATKTEKPVKPAPKPEKLPKDKAN